MPMRRLTVFAVLLLLLPLASLPADGTRAHDPDVVGRQAIPATPAFLAAHSAPAVVVMLPDPDGRGPADRAGGRSCLSPARRAGVAPPAIRREQHADRLPPRLCESLPYDATAPPSIG